MTTARVYEYDSDGRLTRMVRRDAHGRDCRTETYSYDAIGRKTKTIRLETETIPANMMWGIDGTDSCYPAPGAATITTLYDEQGHATTTLFRDVEGREVSRVDLQCDDAGNLTQEAVTRSERSLSSELVGQMNPEQFKTIRELLGVGRKYKYDDLGRRIEEVSYFGPIISDRKTIDYNELGDQILQRSYSHGPEVSARQRRPGLGASCSQECPHLRSSVPLSVR